MKLPIASAYFMLFSNYIYIRNSHLDSFRDSLKNIGNAPCLAGSQTVNGKTEQRMPINLRWTLSVSIIYSIIDTYCII